MNWLARGAAALSTILICGSCGKSGGSSAAAPSKELFSVWTSVTNPTAILDFTGGSFGIAMPITFVYPGGEICDCDLSVLGSQSTGSYVNANCTYRAASGGGVDPGCNVLNGNGTYTNSSATLQICDPACESYR